MINDDEILDWYFKGFNDELIGSSSIIPEEILLQKAYNVGSLHASTVVNDDKRIDLTLVSNEEILKMIENDK
jgi:hypothetical protein